jgi:hypothetical protein
VSAIHYVNSPAVKNGIKNIIGAVSFAGGIAALYQLRHTCRRNLHKPANETVLFLQVVAVLNAIASRPGLTICEWMVHRIATPQTLARIFGENVIFERNPRHPRHVFNIIVNCLSALALSKLISDRYLNKPIKASREMIALTAFYFITGRSTMHLGNDFFYWLFSAKRK